MTVSVVEAQVVTANLGIQRAVTFATTPVAGDLVVIAVQASTAPGNTTFTASGMGVTSWAITDATDSRCAALLIGSGATTSGTVTVFPSNGGAGTSRIQAYLVRGLPAPTVAVAQTTQTSSGATAGPSDAVVAGQFVVDTAAGSGTVTYPSAQLPAASWVSTPVASGHGSAYLIPSGSVTAQTEISTTTSVAKYLTQWVLTPADTSVDGTVNATASAPTVVMSGTVPVVGQVAATAATPAVSIAGDVPTPITGTVTATASAPAVTVAGTMPATGTVNATASAPTVAITGTTGDTVTGTVSATASAPVVKVSALEVTPISLEFEVGARFEITSATPVVPIALEFKVGTVLRIGVDHDLTDDPRTGTPQYQFVIAGRDGTRYGELTEVTFNGVEDAINERGSTSFAIATDDPKHDLITPVERWCQVWRGGVMHHKGPILPGRESDDGTTTTYEVPDPRWLYEHGRWIGRVPRLDLLKNGGFTKGSDGFDYWRATFDSDSIPALPPLWEIIDDTDTLSGKALQVTGADETQLSVEDVETEAVFVPNSSAYLPGGEAAIEAVGAQIPDGATVHIIGHTANDGTGSGLTLSHNRALAAKATLAAQNPTLVFTTASPLWPHDVVGSGVVGRGYYQPKASNSTEDGMAQNRRVTIEWEGTLSAEGHKQFVRQIAYVTHPVDARYDLTITANVRYELREFIAPSGDGWNLRLRAYKIGGGGVIYDESSTSISEDTPLNRWFDLETSVTIPADGFEYGLDLRLYPPAGTARFADAGLYPEEQLYFWGVDQAHIVRDIMAMIQDPSYGWADLGITTRTPATGIRRDRAYEFNMTIPAKQAIDEFPSLARGVDVSMTLAHDMTRLDTHWPRKGGPSSVNLVEGGAVVTSKPASTRDVHSLVLARANSGGTYRPEAVAKDTAALDGLLLGKVITAEAETPITELDEVAQAEVALSKVTTPGYWVDIDPAYTTDLLDRLHLGDTCRLALPSHGFDGMVRMVRRILDPNTDVLSLMLSVEA